MRNHPLTPMRNPDLVSHLQSQTKRRVGLAAHRVTCLKLDALRAEGVEIAVLDCIDDDDLRRVCEAIAHLPLISGRSAPAMKLPEIWRREGWWTPVARKSRHVQSGGRGFLVVAGSCSEATRRQNEWFAAQGAECVVCDPIALVAGARFPVIPAGRDRLVRTASSAADIERVGKWATEQGLTSSAAGLRIAYALGQLVMRWVEECPPEGLIVAGGETSSAICRALRFGALEVGSNIEPGVPLSYPLSGSRLTLVLKSGNFGGVDFYGKAIDAIKGKKNLEDTR